MTYDDTNPDDEFLGPYCAWPRCQCSSPPRCQQDEAYEKHRIDLQEAFDEEFGK